MSGFEANFNQAEVDPAADFLAREQNELVGLEDEVKPAAVTSQQLLNGADEPTNSASSFEIIEGFDQDKDQFGADINSEHDINGTEKETIPEFDYFATNEKEIIPEFGAPSPPVSFSQMQKEEPEKIRKWREEQVKRLEEKDRLEEQKKEELREIAKKELEDWYKNHEETIAKTKAANRNAEKQFVAEDDEIQPGTEWERIAKLCDFNPKAKPGSKDVSRLRSIILQMKQNPVQIRMKS